MRLQSLLDEYKWVAKCRTVVDFQKSVDPLIDTVTPDEVTGRKWTIRRAVDDVVVDLNIEKV